MRNQSVPVKEKKYPGDKTAHRGFTLIELLVVMVILGILATLIVPKFIGRTDDARIQKTQMDMLSLETALKLYKLDNGVYPGTEQGLEALVEEPQAGNLPKRWRKGGYIEKGVVPKDAWSNDFVYLSPGSHGDYDIISYGADGVPGGEEVNADINNWDSANWGSR